MMEKCVSRFLGVLLGTVFSTSHAADIYVSPGGADSGSGRDGQPVASLAMAQQKARQFAGKEAVTVHVANGYYYLPETLIFTSEDSGTQLHPVVYQAETEGGAVLSGGSELKLSWIPYQNGIFKAQTPSGLAIDQLFIDGTNQRMARYPNYDQAKNTEPYQGFAADAFSKERAANWADPTGGYIHAMHRSRWGGYHYRITGKTSQGEIAYEGGWQNNRKSGMHKEFRMVENIFEELDAEGEWHHNAKTNTLYYKPTSGVDLNAAKVEVVRLRHLVEFQGTETDPVKHVSLQGFVVRHAARTFMDCKEQLLRSDWAIYRGGAFMLTGTEDVSILDCEFDQVGGNAVFVNNYNRRTLVKGCHIHDTGASGVCFIGDPGAVRNPLFEYGQKNDLAKIDRTPGPKTQNFPSLGRVEDCLIHGIGRVERQPAGVTMDMASEITVRDCSVYDCARSGINIGDGAWGGHLIERCDVFDTVLETHDHGSFNSWGRDRYWRSDHLTATQKAVDQEPTLPFLDAIKTTVIRNSRWRCDHGWDIDLDDGSSNYDLYNNLMLGSGLKFREGFRRRAWNNITPVGGFHPHVWFQRSKDQVYNNIFTQQHRFARMNEPYVDGGTLVDRNLFNTDDQRILASAAKCGWDGNSLLGDPLFIDPAGGDFRVKDGSPALELGFKNFPMDQFGVKKASLKAIAKTPEIPSLEKGEFDNRGRRVKTAIAVGPMKKVWMGATLEDLKGEAFSAFGVSKEEGGVALMNAPEGTGLKVGDLIQGINGTEVKNTNGLFNTLAKTRSTPLTVKVVRNQQVISLIVQPASYVQIEDADSADEFKELTLKGPSDWTTTASTKTNNEPLAALTDGKIAANYGPIFGNGVRNGIYKMDLGKPKAVAAVTSWTHSQTLKRGTQRLTVYGSSSKADPGWDLTKMTASGTIQTSETKSKFAAASLRAADGKSLGKFRWIAWAVSPVSNQGGGENSAFQELAVEILSN